MKSLLKLVDRTDPVLQQQADPVTLPISSEINDLISEMLVTMVAEKGCGLAAPQVGRPLRIFVYHHNGEMGTVINPVVMLGSLFGMVTEGCLSYPGERYSARRAQSIMCSWVDQDGKRQRLQTIQGFKSIIFQHEYDHLMGRVLPQHAGLIVGK